MRKTLIILVMLLSVTIVPAFAQGTIADVVSDSGDFSLLAEAIEAAGLTGTLSSGEYTVFAPTDGAFRTLVTAQGISREQLLQNTDLLTTLLGYHVVEGRIPFSELDRMSADRNDRFLTLTSLNGLEIRMTVDPNNNTATLNNGQASIVNRDVQASNGVIHVIDNVLLPPVDLSPGALADGTQAAATPDGTPAATPDGTPAPTTVGSMTGAVETDGPVLASTGGTVADIIAGDNDFSLLLAAVQGAGLTETLAGSDAEYTVFAPTNQAFRNLLSTTGMTPVQLLDSPLLEDIVLYHVVEGKVLSDDVAVLAAQDDPVPTLLDNNFIAIEADDSGNVIINNIADVIQVDVDATNGAVHVIDQVLLPQAALEGLGLASSGS